ncbi:MAG: ABC transporter ATP-binding protein [Myxococcota bacterium]
MSEAIIRLAGVARRFTSPPRTVFSDVDLEVDAGEMVALVGPSGGGKTTLLSIMGALDSRFSGRVDLVGQSLSGLSDDALSRLRGETIGFVFQAFHLLDHLSVVENVELALWLIGASVAPAEARERASEALSNVGLGGRDDERVAQLSGGERQRVAIARAVVHQPRLLLADEPTGNLDAKTAEVIVRIFDEIRQQAKCAVIMATHDLALAGRADRVVRLADGRLAQA